MIAALLAGIAAVVLILEGEWWWGAALGVGLLGMLYPIPFLPENRRPKDLPLLKTALIMGCWVGGGIFLPGLLFGGPDLIEFDARVTWPLLIGYRAAYVLPNLIAVDWLDREGDRRERAGNLVAHWSRRQALLAISTVCSRSPFTAHMGWETVQKGNQSTASGSVYFGHF